MKLNQNQYYGLKKEMPGKLPVGSIFFATDEDKLYMFGEDERGSSPSSITSIATDSVLGVVKISDGVQVDASGNLTIKVGSGIKFDASKNVTIDAPNIDVTTLNKADTLVSSVYQDALNATSTLSTLANAAKGSWWNVAAAVTISGTAFAVGDQLWCRANVIGTPVNLTNFVRVPASVAIATNTTFGTVKYSSTLPLKSSTAPAIGVSQSVSREDHVHPKENFSVQPWALANTYSSGDVVSSNNLYWKANANIVANTAFVEGTIGATWQVMKFPVRHDSTLVVGSFGIDATGIYFEEGLTI